jgi:hypothetical protein
MTSSSRRWLGRRSSLGAAAAEQPTEAGEGALEEQPHVKSCCKVAAGRDVRMRARLCAGRMVVAALRFMHCARRAVARGLQGGRSVNYWPPVVQLCRATALTGHAHHEALLARSLRGEP